MSQVVGTGGKWNGEVFESFLRQSVQKAESFDTQRFPGGLLSVQTGFNKALYYPKISLTGEILQDYDPTGVDSGAVGTYTADGDAKVLALQELSVKIADIDPNDWRDFWTALQLSPDVLYTFPNLPPEVQQAYLLELLEEMDWIHEQNIWTGARASGDATSINRYNGLLTFLETAGDFVDATPSGATAFTSANINEAMDGCIDLLYSNARMKAVESRRRNELKIFVSKKTARLLIQAEQNISGKGETRLTSNGIYDLIYSGAAPVCPLAAFPDDRILITYANSNARRSNLHFGMSNLRDKTNVEVQRMSNLSNYVGMRMDMAAGTAIPFTEECIYYKVPA